MSTNPFHSSIFLNVWNRHFNNSKDGFYFNFVEGVSFIKHSFLQFYSNTGGKLTNGIDYSIQKNEEDYQGKVFLIRDIPSYQNNERKLHNSSLKLKKVAQYEGYTTKVNDYKDLDAYMLSNFKSNSRSKFRRNMKRLEAAFDIDYVMYYGAISKETFDILFEEFYALLEKRYQDKKEPCGELQPKLWNFYCELAYKMVNDKTASLFVIYSNNKPIGITFSYHFGTILIEALTVFDIDYYRFNIGHTTIYKMLEWSFENKIELFDYTQGDFEYKRRWSDRSYITHFHLLYDSKSLKSKLIASCFVFYFNLKRNLRDRKMTKYYHNFKHYLGTMFTKRDLSSETYTIEKSDKLKIEPNEFEEIDLNSNEFASQRRTLYNYLYMNSEPAKNFKAVMSSKKVFYVFSDISVLKIYRS